jgi:cell division protein FtsB
LTGSAGRRMRLPRFGIGAQVIALVLVLGLVSAMAIQPTRELLAQQHRISATAQELRRTELANRRLDQRIARLRNPDFIEEQARAEIGLVRPGEIAYVVMPKANKAKTAHKGRNGGGNGRVHGSRRAGHEAAEPNDGVIGGFLNFLGL